VINEGVVELCRWCSAFKKKYDSNIYMCIYYKETCCRIWFL